MLYHSVCYNNFGFSLSQSESGINAMSLFPAYSSSHSGTQKQEDANEADQKLSAENSSWLANPSFSIEVSEIPLPAVKKEIYIVSDSDSQDSDIELLEEEDKKQNVVVGSSNSVKAESPESFKWEKQDVVAGSSNSIRAEPLESFKRKKSSKHKKNHRKHKKQIQWKSDKRRHAEPEIPGRTEGNVFFEDRNCEKSFLMVPTLTGHAKPLYDVLPHCSIGKVNKRKRKWKKRHGLRYYKHIHNYCPVEETQPESDASNVCSIKQEPKKEDGIDGDVVLAFDHKLEEDLSKTTAQYNKNLAEEPSNIELWIKYARFQDVIWQFEKTYRRGGGAKGARVTAERKLAILDKALQHNPDSEMLLKEKISIAESVYQPDILSRQLADMLEKQPSKLALWFGYLGATQCSLALCTVPAVLKLYNQAMERLHQFRRGAIAAQTKPTEEKIIALFYDCGMFLRQAGLWEQLWLLLRLYLELNLTHPGSNFLKIESTLSEQLVREKEDQILSSELPLSELWLRIEQLREGAHWLPWTSDKDCEDPQRLVFSDDVSDFLHPITSPSLLPNLTAIALVLLKVPVLPCRNTALCNILPYMKPWSIDSVEMLLAAMFPMGTVDLDCGNLFKDITKLSVGPQYLEERLGHEQYLEFVTKVFRLCADQMPEQCRIAFYVWWLRFERLLLVLDKLGLCKLPQARKKNFKSMIKNFLKQDLNRNCLLFYREYALIEWELGHYEGACKILETAIISKPESIPVVSVLNEQDKNGLGSLYRTLCELYLRRSMLPKEDSSFNKQKAASVLLALALGKQLNSIDFSTASPELLVEASEKFRHITTELMQDSNADTPASVGDHLLPDFFVDWVTCQAWLLFLTHSVWSAGALLEDTMAKMTTSSCSAASISLRSCQIEALFEACINMLHHHCIESSGTYSLLKDTLLRAMKQFPNNLYFLVTAAKLQTGSNGIGAPWWEVRRYLNEADSPLARIFVVLLARQRYTQKEKLATQTHNYLQTAGPIVPDKSMQNLLRALFSQMEQHPLTKRCPLIWRLYLRFLYDHGADGSCKTAFYRAVEECPWVKALYIDASKLVPEELPQIQDLIIEKELRLHVTPEELDVLRGAPS